MTAAESKALKKGSRVYWRGGWDERCLFLFLALFGQHSASLRARGKGQCCLGADELIE